MIIELLTFLFILSFLVFVHELGHFFTAKYFGIKVEEFGMGLPPRAWGKKVGETVYSLNWLPIGGYVQILGENLEGFDPNDQRNFQNKPPYQRFIVLFAGVFMNLILAALIFYITVAHNGWKSNTMMLLGDFRFPYGENVILNNVVTLVGESSPAEKAGLKFGERIVSINYGDEVIQLENTDQLKDVVKNYADTEITLNLEDVQTRESRSVSIKPEYNEELKQAGLGVGLNTAIEVHYVTPAQKFGAGFLHGINLLDYNYRILGSLISSAIKSGDASPVAESVSGPVGIYNVVDAVIAGSPSGSLIWNLLDLAAIISLSLGIMNLLPLPALDGGRIVFVISEWITGKRASQKLESQIHQVGFVFLIGLIVLVTFKDIWQLF